jgi:glycosyltransferase involved in cell wall biosynthesis
VPSGVALIVTARNEADRLGATLSALARAFPGAPAWVADDCSTDATAEIARASGARVVRGQRALGKGGAATRAAREALKDTRAARSIFVLCDGDLAESAAELTALADAIGQRRADLAVAAFTTRVGGGVGLAVGFARWAIRRRCGLDAKAPISGQRAMHGEVLGDLLPFAPGFGMELGMTIDAVRAGYRVVEVELDLAHRASARTPTGFVHRGRQLADFARAYLARR